MTVPDPARAGRYAPYWWADTLCTAGGVKKSKAIRSVSPAALAFTDFFLRWLNSIRLGSRTRRGDTFGIETALKSAFEIKRLCQFRRPRPGLSGPTRTGSAESGPIFFRDRLAELRRHPPAVRAAALQLLDLVSRPMTVREIEHALRDAGVSRSQRVKLAGALKGLAIIAIVGGAGEIMTKGERA